jgi:glycerol dehydrogenase-like iron-containing ADH family enzyme
LVYHHIKMVWLNLSTPTTPLQTPYEQLFKVIAGWYREGQESTPICRSTTRAQTLSDIGVSKDQSSKSQKMAAIQKEEREGYLAQPGIPYTQLEANLGLFYRLHKLHKLHKLGFLCF